VLATKGELIPKKAAKSEVETPPNKTLARDHYRTKWFAQARKKEKKHHVSECNESDNDRKMAAVSNNNRNMEAPPRDGENEEGVSGDKTQEEGELEECTPEPKLENANLVDGVVGYDSFQQLLQSCAKKQAQSRCWRDGRRIACLFEESQTV
jgi:hypothetical protein